MNQLLPIVRRVRRPLSSVEPKPAAAPAGKVAEEETAANGRPGPDLVDAADDTPDSTASNATPTAAQE
jgi:hypothetical protein